MILFLQPRAEEFLHKSGSALPPKLKADDDKFSSFLSRKRGERIETTFEAARVTNQKQQQRRRRQLLLLHLQQQLHHRKQQQQQHIEASHTICHNLVQD